MVITTLGGSLEFCVCGGGVRTRTQGLVHSKQTITEPQLQPSDDPVQYTTLPLGVVVPLFFNTRKQKQIWGFFSLAFKSCKRPQ